MPCPPLAAVSTALKFMAFGPGAKMTALDSLPLAPEDRAILALEGPTVAGGRSRELILPCLGFEARAARMSCSWPRTLSSAAGCPADWASEATVAHNRAIEKTVS